MKNRQEVSARTYVIGFIGSLVFTLSAYIAITHRLFDRRNLIFFIVALAFAQFITQLVCFLHLGAESKPRWKQLVFWAMIGVVVILVFGSIWIMNNLNYHMSPQQMYQYINNQSDGI